MSNLETERSKIQAEKSVQLDLLISQIKELEAKKSDALAHGELALLDAYREQEVSIAAEMVALDPTLEDAYGGSIDDLLDYLAKKATFDHFETKH